MSGTVAMGRHYMWLFLWWFCLYYAIAKGSMASSLAFLVIFFISCTYKTLFRSVLIGLACAFLANIPFLNLVLMGIGLICILLRAKFLLSNWRVLFVGLYAYGVHFCMLLANSFRSLINGAEKAMLGANMSGIETAASAAQTASDVITFSGILIATVMTLILHFMIRWLYKHNYSTERAFLIMGLTPLIVGATLFPFISHMKIGGYDVTGDSFLDADSLSDAAASLTGTETGFMGAAAHGTHAASSRQEQDSTETASEQGAASGFDTTGNSPIR